MRVQWWNRLVNKTTHIYTAWCGKLAGW